LYYDFMIKGVRYKSRIPGARNKAEALLAERDARFEVYQGTYGKPCGEEVFVKYAEKVYLEWAKENKRSWQADTCHVEVFKRHFAQRRFNEFDRLLIEKFKRERLNSRTKNDQERAPASVNRELACLSKIFALAKRDRLVAENPCLEVPKLAEDNKRYSYLSREQEELLLSRFTGQRAHLRNLVIFAINTGARKGEILGLRKECVDLRQGIVWFTNSRRSGSRVAQGIEKSSSE